MRFRAPYAEDVLDFLKMIVALPVVLPFLGIVYLCDLKDRLMGPDDNWRPWFAWFPVRLPDNRMVWLEWIERRWHIEQMYRVPSTPSGEG